MHGLSLVDILVAVPRVVENPGRLALRERAEGMHPHLILKPAQRACALEAMCPPLPAEYSCAIASTTPYRLYTSAPPEPLSSSR